MAPVRAIVRARASAAILAWAPCALVCSISRTEEVECGKKAVVSSCLKDSITVSGVRGVVCGDGVRLEVLLDVRSGGEVENEVAIVDHMVSMLL